MNYNLCLQHVLSEASEKQAPQPGRVRVVLQLLRRGEKVFTAPRRSSWQAGRRWSDSRKQGREGLQRCWWLHANLQLWMPHKTTEAPFFVKTKDTQPVGLQFICVPPLISSPSVHQLRQFILLEVLDKPSNRLFQVASYRNIWLGFYWIFISCYICLWGQKWKEV